MRAGARHMRPLFISFLLIVTFLVVQVIVGIATGSLALLSDAGHMATDALGLGMALAAIHAASSSLSHPQRTFGLYRLEILAALANAALLFLVAGWVLFEAISRIGDAPDVASLPVLDRRDHRARGERRRVRAAARRGEGEPQPPRRLSRSALRHARIGGGHRRRGRLGTDGLDVGRPRARRGDRAVHPSRAWKLGGQALRVLLQAAPEGVDVAAVQSDLAAIDDVVDVHDLHVWTLTSEMDVASAHVMVRVGTDTHRVLDTARTVLRERHGLDHATLQIEPDDHRGCDEMSW